jgi:hypothetical protein
MKTDGITELLEHLSIVSENTHKSISELLEKDEYNCDIIHVKVGDLLCIIDFLIESGVVDSKILQNHKIYSRIRFNETRKHMTDRVVVIPNFQPVPSKWEQ